MNKRTKRSKSRKANRTKKHIKQQGGDMEDQVLGNNVLKESITGFVPENKSLTKGRRNEWLEVIKKVKNEDIYFYFDGTGCSNSGTKTSKIMSMASLGWMSKRNLVYDKSKLLDNKHTYGAVFCRGNIIQQIGTSVSTVIEGGISCESSPLKLSPFIRYIKKLIATLINNNNKVFLYGHSYGGTLVTKIMQGIKIDDKNVDKLYGRTFGAPFVRPVKNLLHFVYEGDEIISQHKKCVNDSVVIPFDLKNYKKVNDKYIEPKKIPHLWYWTTDLGWEYHLAYSGPFMQYVINNIDKKNPNLAVSKVRTKITNEINGGIFGSDLARKIVKEHFNYSYE